MSRPFKLAFRPLLGQQVRTGMTLAAGRLGVGNPAAARGFVPDLSSPLDETLLPSPRGRAKNGALRAGFGATLRTSRFPAFKVSRLAVVDALCQHV